MTTVEHDAVVGGTKGRVQGTPASNWVDIVTNVAAVVCLLGAVLAVLVGWLVWRSEPDGIDAPERAPITDVTTYDVDANGQPEFVEIEGGVHRIPAPAAGVDMWVVLVPVVGTVVSSLIGAAGSFVVGRLNKDVGEQLQSLERLLADTG